MAKAQDTTNELKSAPLKKPLSTFSSLSTEMPQLTSSVTGKLIRAPLMMSRLWIDFCVESKVRQQKICCSGYSSYSAIDIQDSCSKDQSATSAR